MLANVVALVPKVLIEHRLNGVVVSIFIGVALSLLFFYVFANSMFKFPGKGEPEIIKAYTPKWFASSYLFIIGIFYFIAAGIILLTFIDITLRFINPDMSSLYTAFLFLSIVCAGALMKTEKTLYALEIILVISLPLILGIFLKSLFNPYLSWDSMKVIVQHSFDSISIESVGAASYSFVGFYYLAIYNRLFTEKVKPIKIRYILLIGIVGTVNIFTSLMIPIGYNGVDGIGDFNYPWFSTADAIRMEFGFIERVLFIFLLLYIGISIISATISSHTGLEIIKSVLPSFKWKNRELMPIIVILLFSMVTILAQYYLPQGKLYEFTKIFFIGLLGVGMFKTFLMIWIVRRAKK